MQWNQSITSNFKHFNCVMNYDMMFKQLEESIREEMEQKAKRWS